MVSLSLRSETKMLLLMVALSALANKLAAITDGSILASIWFEKEATDWLVRLCGTLGFRLGRWDSSLG